MKEDDQHGDTFLLHFLKRKGQTFDGEVGSVMELIAINQCFNDHKSQPHRFTSKERQRDNMMGQIDIRCDN